MILNLLISSSRSSICSSYVSLMFSTYSSIWFKQLLLETICSFSASNIILWICSNASSSVNFVLPFLVKEKAVRKPRAKKVQQVPQAEVATPEKLAKLRKPRAKKTEKNS